MQTQRKVFYESPISEVIEVRFHGVLCESPDGSVGPLDSFTSGGNPLVES